jgi:hypothetical protein
MEIDDRWEGKSKLIGSLTMLGGVTVDFPVDEASRGRSLRFPSCRSLLVESTLAPGCGWLENDSAAREKLRVFPNCAIKDSKSSHQY